MDKRRGHHLAPSSKLLLPPLWALVLCFAKPLSGRRLPSFQVDGTHDDGAQNLIEKQAELTPETRGSIAPRFDEHRADGCLSPRVVCRQRVKRITRNGRGNWDWISEWNLPGVCTLVLRLNNGHEFVLIARPICTDDLSFTFRETLFIY